MKAVFFNWPSLLRTNENLKNIDFKIEIKKNYYGYYLVEPFSGMQFSATGYPIKTIKEAKTLRKFLNKYFSFMGWNGRGAENTCFSLKTSVNCVEEITKIDNEEFEKHQMVSNGPREDVMKKCGGKCMHCGSTENLVVDHIIPKSKGGSNKLENLQILCSPCNSKKGNRFVG